jgi:hypothetical protein
LHLVPWLLRLSGPQRQNTPSAVDKSKEQEDEEAVRYYLPFLLLSLHTNLRTLFAFPQLF